MLRTLIFRYHGWVGLSAGCVLALNGATGALLATEHAVVDALNRDVRVVAERPDPLLRAGALLERVQEQLPDRAIRSLETGGRSDAVRVLIEPREAPAPGGRRPRPDVRYADPYTGALQAGSGTRGEEAFRAVLQIHRWLVFPGGIGSQEVGKAIVGACALAGVLLVLSGLYLRWPRRTRSWRTWLAIDWRRRGRAFLWSLHAALGTWVLLVYLVILLSGLQWSYDWYKRGAYALAGVELPAREGPGRGAQRGEGKGEDAPVLPVAERAAALDRAAARLTELAGASGFSVQTASFTAPGRADQPVEIRYLETDAAHERASSTLVVEARSGKAVRHERYAEKTWGGKLVASFYALHTGVFFGLAGQLVFGLASALMPVLSITGWQMFRGRGRARRASAQIRRGLAAGIDPRAAEHDEPRSATR